MSARQEAAGVNTVVRAATVGVAVVVIFSSLFAQRNICCVVAVIEFDSECI
jgi:hypothetical protein